MAQDKVKTVPPQSPAKVQAKAEPTVAPAAVIATPIASEAQPTLVTSESKSTQAKPPARQNLKKVQNVRSEVKKAPAKTEVKEAK